MVSTELCADRHERRIFERVPNDAAAELFPGATSSSQPNLARWIFTEPAARIVLVDWALVAEGVLARLRTNAGKHPGSPRFQRLEDELRTASPEAEAWWPRYDIATSEAGVKRVRSLTGAEHHMTTPPSTSQNNPSRSSPSTRPARPNTAVTNSGPAQAAEGRSGLTVRRQ